MIKSYKDEPKNLLYIDEIKEIEEKPNGKASHFILKLHSGYNLHLKASSDAEAKKWVYTLKEIKKIYRSKDLKDVDANKPWKQKLDIRSLQIVMEEVESS